MFARLVFIPSKLFNPTELEQKYKYKYKYNTNTNTTEIELKYFERLQSCLDVK